MWLEYTNVHIKFVLQVVHVGFACGGIPHLCSKCKFVRVRTDILCAFIFKYNGACKCRFHFKSKFKSLYGVRAGGALSFVTKGTLRCVRILIWHCNACTNVNLQMINYVMLEHL